MMGLRSFLGSLSAGVALLVACGGSDSTIPGGADGTSSEAGASDAPGGNGDGGNTTDSTTIPTDSSTPIEAGPPTLCKVDADCTETGTVGNAGACFLQGGVGSCICAFGFHTQVDGKCGLTAAPDCKTQGGLCAQNTSTCPPGNVEGSPDTDRSCGDLVASACCFPAATCKGLTFGCCGPAKAAHQQICENGHLTCQPGDRAVMTGTTCN